MTSPKQESGGKKLKELCIRCGKETEYDSGTHAMESGSRTGAGADCRFRDREEFWRVDRACA